MVTPEDDYPHPVPPQAFMTWKENWVFPAVDTEQRVATLFHFSLRPGAGEGIFTAKFSRRRLGAPLRRPLARAARPDRVRPRAEREDRLRGARARRAVPDHLQRRRARRRASSTPARFPTWDFDDNAARARRVAARRPRPRRLPLPPLRAGAPARGHDHAAGRPACRRDDPRLGLREPRPLVGLARGPHLPPPPLALRLVRGPLRPGHGDERAVLPGRGQARRLDLDRVGERRRRARRHGRRLLARAGRAAAASRPRRALPPDDRRRRDLHGRRASRERRTAASTSTRARPTGRRSTRTSRSSAP